MPQRNPPPLSGKTALVTGAGRGIGRAVALALGEAGARVVLTARSRDELNEAAAALREKGGQARAFAADLAMEEEILALFATVRAEEKRLDILVNNAGLGLFGPASSYGASDWDHLQAVNVRGPFLCCREALSLMRAQEQVGPVRGHIVNIGSVVSFKGYPEQAAYAASKHALLGLTKSLAAEVQQEGIKVSAVLPGGVDTAMAGQARPDLGREGLLQPEDVADTVLFILTLPPRAAVDQIHLRRAGSAPFI